MPNLDRLVSELVAASEGKQFERTAQRVKDYADAGAFAMAAWVADNLSHNGQVVELSKAVAKEARAAFDSKVRSVNFEGR